MLAKRYEKQHHEENNRNKGIFILEESMGEHLANKWTKSVGPLINIIEEKSGSYSLGRNFSFGNVWLEGSLVVALQYIKGKYRISGLTPDSGFTKENLNDFETPLEWREKVPSCKLFPLEGHLAGFGTSHETGVWNVGRIPFHVHHPDGEDREWYSAIRGEFYQRILNSEPLI
jgi:hypothetical protein